MSAHDKFLLHVMMISSALVLTLASLIIHVFFPDDEFSMMTGIASLGFLFGKFTNQFNLRPFSEREVLEDRNAGKNGKEPDH